MDSNTFAVYVVSAIGVGLLLLGSINPPLAPWLTGSIRVVLAVTGLAVVGGAFVWAQLLE